VLIELLPACAADDATTPCDLRIYRKPLSTRRALSAP
jgi:hypothetical protein